MNSFTGRLAKRLVGAGDLDWDDELHDNEKIADFVAAGLLGKNRVISGGALSVGAGLDVNYEAMVVEVAGVRYAISAGSIAATASILNYVYVDSTGVVAVSVLVPSGEFAPLGLGDAGAAAIDRTGDARPMAKDIHHGENIFINGDCRIDQEREGAAATGITTARTDAIDMFAVPGCNCASVVSAQRVAGFAGFDNALQVVVTAADTLAAGERGHGIEYKIETADCQAIRDRVLHKKFMFMSNKTGTFSVALVSGNASNSYVVDFAYPSAGVAQEVEVRIPVPTAKVVSGATGEGLVLYIGRHAYDVAGGATATLGAWQAGAFFSSTAATDWETVNGNYIKVTGLYGCADLAPADYPFRAKRDELALCQRYVSKSYDQGTVPGTATVAGCLSARVPISATAVIGMCRSFQVEMRTIPTLIFYSPVTAGSAGKIYNLSTATDLTVTTALYTGATGFSRVDVSTTVLDGHTVLMHYIAKSRM